MKITIKDLGREEALQLLKNVQENCGPMAIQGKKEMRWYNTDTVTASVTVQEDPNTGEKDYSKNTFEIRSSYWQESTLKEYMSEA